MGEGLTHILSPLSAPWCGWTMLVLLLCAVAAEWLQPGVITQAPSSLLARTDRTYKESPVTFAGQFFIALFRIGTIGMSLCLCLCANGMFSFTRFAVICSLVVGMFLLKMLCNITIDYTFMLSRRFGDAYEHYGNIMTLAVLVLYPADLVLLRVDNPMACLWTLGAIVLLFIGMWIYRSARMFAISPIAVLYMILYICTVELLPCAALYVLSAKMITII